MDDPDFILFQNYLFQHGKAYDEGLLEKRFSAFRQNLVLIEQQNAAEKAAGGTAVYGLTEFSDLTPEEFNNLYLTHNMDAGKPEILVDPESYVGSSTSLLDIKVDAAVAMRFQQLSKSSRTQFGYLAFVKMFNCRLNRLRAARIPQI
eukprot:gene1873-2204_t